MHIIPRPDSGPRHDTPTPVEITRALRVLNAYRVAPGVWIAVLSTGQTVRITAPGAAYRVPPTVTEVDPYTDRAAAKRADWKWRRTADGWYSGPDGGAL